MTLLQTLGVFLLILGMTISPHDHNLFEGTKSLFAFTFESSLMAAGFYLMWYH